MRLYAASGDRDVPIGNAQACQAELAAHGVHVTIVDEGPVDHTGSAIAAIPQILDWFIKLG